MNNDKQCERCGEVNPAEIHTCSPQEPQPEPEWVTWLDCLLTGVCAAEGHSIQKLQREWQGLTEDDAIGLLPNVGYEYEVDIEVILEFAKAIEDVLRRKNS